MFKYFILFTSLIALASCTNSEVTPSSTINPKWNATETASKPREEVLYVDVREDDEWKAGHIEWALHVKLGDIEAGKFDQIPKDTPVSLYCRSGRRSGIAYDILTKAGYINVKNVWGMDGIASVKIVRE